MNDHQWFQIFLQKKCFDTVNYVSTRDFCWYCCFFFITAFLVCYFKEWVISSFQYKNRHFYYESTTQRQFFKHTYIVMLFIYGKVMRNEYKLKCPKKRSHSLYWAQNVNSHSQLMLILAEVSVSSAYTK